MSEWSWVVLGFVIAYGALAVYAISLVRRS